MRNPTTKVPLPGRSRSKIFQVFADRHPFRATNPRMCPVLQNHSAILLHDCCVYVRLQFVPLSDFRVLSFGIWEQSVNDFRLLIPDELVEDVLCAFHHSRCCCVGGSSSTSRTYSTGIVLHLPVSSLWTRILFPPSTSSMRPYSRRTCPVVLVKMTNPVFPFMCGLTAGRFTVGVGMDVS